MKTKMATHRAKKKRKTKAYESYVPETSECDWQPGFPSLFATKRTMRKKSQNKGHRLAQGEWEGQDRSRKETGSTEAHPTKLVQRSTKTAKEGSRRVSGGVLGIGAAPISPLRTRHILYNTGLGIVYTHTYIQRTLFSKMS